MFFGRQKANGVLLSHIITFLNDKTDWQLRGAFFDTIVGVASYIGMQSMNILTPLLQQVSLSIALYDFSQLADCARMKYVVLGRLEANFIDVMA